MFLHFTQCIEYFYSINSANLLTILIKFTQWVEKSFNQLFFNALFLQQIIRCLFTLTSAKRMFIHQPIHDNQPKKQKNDNSEYCLTDS